jgi:MFS family permease
MKDVKTVALQDAVDENVKNTPRKSSWGVIAKFSLVRSTSGLGWGFIDSLMPLYFFIRFGLGGEFLGPIYAAARLLSVFSYMLIPRFVDRFGEIPTIVLSRFITALLTFAFSITPWMPLAVIIMVTLRIAIMFTMPIRQSFAIGLVNPEETATAIGVSNFARMSLRTVAPTVAGYMFETISFSMPFITGATLLIVNGLLFRAFFLPKK